LRRNKAKCGPEYVYSEVNGKRVFSDRNHRFLHAVGLGHKHVFLTKSGRKVKKLSRGKKPRRGC